MGKRRLLVLVSLLVVGALVAFAGWVAWLGWQAQGDLREAQDHATQLRAALGDRDAAAAERAGDALAASARSAMDRTDGLDWTVATWLPVIGDDAEGVRAISSSLHTLAVDGVAPLVAASGDVDRLTVEGGVDLDVVAGLREPVEQGYDAVTRAADEVRAVDSDGFVGRVRAPYEEYVELVEGLESGLGAARTAVDLLPPMAGGEGPREYLLVVQNNAEIRASGGLPGAFVLLGADGGRLSILRQGGPRDFESDLEQPILPLSEAEQLVYDDLLGTFFQDANFTPDFPRTAELMNAHWEASGAQADLDGVLSIDPVALSYVLGAIGPVEVDGRTLTQDNLIEELLSTPYLELEPEAQDQLFADAARVIFEEAVGGGLGDPLAFLEGLARAGREGRFLISSFDEAEQEQLAGTRVAGELTGDDGATPHVDVSLNDATGSKMSYYLRYGVETVSEGCRDDGQRLAGSMRMRQTIDQADAEELPESVTGGGIRGTPAGAQLVIVRLYGPYGGSIDRVRLGSDVLNPGIVELDGRPVAVLNVFLSSTEPIDLDWRMTTAAGQTDDVEVGVTPSIVPGDKNFTTASSCTD
ncbi:DUF4012 domain-containing protein [Nocardioides lentus]|uniref:DUF4012 domain-containing protein n=1 Tax=Nocardioides lentus TaxID=338077 RepID=A0ABP5AKH4_9ACTN